MGLLRDLERRVRRTLRPGWKDKRLESLESELRSQRRQLETLLDMLAGQELRRVRALPAGTPLQTCEFRVTSQFGEDGIIQHLLAHVPIPSRRFVEFGVEDFREANCRYLMEVEPWEGLVLDGDPALKEKLEGQKVHWARNLRVRSAFITAENIDSLLVEEGFTGDLGILSIDIDGNDYWVWKAITSASPRIVIVEYNSIFGCRHPVTIPYEPAFMRQTAHFSWLYAGASLSAFTHLAESKGYAFVGSNSAGNNAFFVRKDVLGSLRPLTPEEGYVESTFRESRTVDGTQSFLSGKDRLRLIADMPLINVVTGERMLAGDLV